MRNNILSKDELIQKEARAKIHIIIKTELLDNNSSTDGYLGKKLKNITIDYTVLLIMLNENMPKFKYRFETISSPYGRINYIFKVLEEQISR